MPVTVGLDTRVKCSIIQLSLGSLDTECFLSTD